MKVLFCSPEVAPHAKTGGLADVSASLPPALRDEGVECHTVMPRYGQIPLDGFSEEMEMSVLTGFGITRATVWRRDNHFFIDQPHHFGRTGLYTYDHQDFPDNLERFAFFSLACIELARLLGDVDVIHANDWQTALIPAYLHALGIRDLGCLFTIHNLAYQGVFNPALWPLLLLPGEYFSTEALEYYGKINILKAGIVFADRINTVSPTYAAEICTPAGGYGLDGLLRAQGNRLDGIVNGIDPVTWDPQTDPHLSCNFTRDHPQGKNRCKQDLQEHLSLDRRADLPLLAMISRLEDQKGIDLIIEALPHILVLGCQVAILGSGRHEYEQALRSLAAEYPESLGVHIGFNESLAHIIEAGADFFLMPSRFEPCGLNQMISQRYGTLPLVTAVGGLRDTVSINGESNNPCGFIIESYTLQSLMSTVGTAHHLFTQHPQVIEDMKFNAMRNDYTWSRSAGKYRDTYQNILKIKERDRF